MRFETQLQPKFGKLIDDLKIELIPFNGPKANPSPFPQYDLPLQEQNLDALALLRRGILLMMGKLPNNPIDYGCQDWIDSLTEDDSAHKNTHIIGAKPILIIPVLLKEQLILPIGL